MLKLTPVSAHSPVFNDDTGNSIFLYVKFEEFADELPFSATNYDVMDYGRQLYSNAMSGMYGPIEPYVPPPAPPLTQPSGEIPGAIL